MKRARLRVAVAAGGAMLVAVAAVGALHTQDGRRLMARMGVPCPVDNVTAAQVTRLREAGLHEQRGVQDAPTRRALGMTLGQTTQADVLRWQASTRADCAQLQRGYAYLRCRGVDARAVGAQGPALSEVWFSFGPDGRLVGVDLYRRGLDDAGTEQAWADARDRLLALLGAPGRTTGDASPAVLRASALRTARIEYRYADYLATVTAVNLPHAGLAVREQYTLAD